MNPGFLWLAFGFGWLGGAIVTQVAERRRSRLMSVYEDRGLELLERVYEEHTTPALLAMQESTTAVIAAWLATRGRPVTNPGAQMVETHEWCPRFGTCIEPTQQGLE